MPQKEIVVNIERGIVDVFASDPACRVIVVNWDEGIDPPDPHMIEVPRGRRSDSAFVVAIPVQALSELAGSDVEQAIEIACDQGAIEFDEGAVPC